MRPCALRFRFKQSLVTLWTCTLLVRYEPVASLVSTKLGRFAIRPPMRRWASTELSDNELFKWERMYEEGRSGGELSEREERARQLRSEVRVVTFDLDDTLWKTSDTISAANDALAAFLDQQKVVQPKRVEKVMGDLFKSNKERYCPVNTNTTEAPVLLTQLRKDALRHILKQHNDYNELEATQLADVAFGEWTRARHDAIPSHFASCVQDCLREIRSIRTSSEEGVLIGAITDGNSDPRLIDGLASYFDFCINAESVGVAKPDKRVYLEAVQHVLQDESLQDLLLPTASTESDDLLDRIGPWWVHIGDDFVKDVVAGKDCNMRTIWARELVLDKLKSEATTEIRQSERSVEDLVKKVSEMKVIKMEVGAEDYLAESLQQEFADAVVDRFSDVASVLLEWHDEALQSTVRDDNSSKEPTTEDDILQVIMPDTPSTHDRQDDLRSANPDDNSPTSTTRDTKFCLFCGAKAPIEARFCPSCGEKQPQLPQ